MSESMVKRVKAALSFYTLVCVWEHEDDSFDSSGSEYEIRGVDGSVLKITGETRAAEKYDDLRARAAIAAMREPTEDMMQSGFQSSPHDVGGCRDQIASDKDWMEKAVLAPYQAMINAALTPAKVDEAG